MKKFFLFTLFSCLVLYADVPTQMVHLYQKGAYYDVCSLGNLNFKKLQSTEKFVSLYAFACLNADQIDRLSLPVTALNETSEARANASYFSLIVLQKKLLIQALYDNYTMKSLKLPTSSHLLSRIFDYYGKNSQPGNAIKEYSDHANPRQTYKLYTIQIDTYKTFAIDEYYDKILVRHHVY